MPASKIRTPATTRRRRIGRMMPAVPGRPTRYVRAVEALLFAWFAEHGRDLPWRRTRDPYAILVSEVMSQQTQMERVVPRWQRWLERWPTIETLAAAPAGDVIREWQGLGYNPRALAPPPAPQHRAAHRRAPPPTPLPRRRRLHP